MANVHAAANQPHGNQPPPRRRNIIVWVVLVLLGLALGLFIVVLVGVSIGSLVQSVVPAPLQQAPVASVQLALPIPQPAPPQQTPVPQAVPAPSAQATAPSVGPDGPFAGFRDVLNGANKWDGLGFIVILALAAILLVALWFAIRFFTSLFGAVGGIRFASLVGFAACAVILAILYGAITNPGTTAMKISAVTPVRNAIVKLVVGGGSPATAQTPTATTVQQTGIADSCPLFQSAGASCIFGPEGSGSIGIARDVPAGSHLCWTPGPEAFLRIEYLSGKTGAWERFDSNREPSNVTAYRFFPKETVEMVYNTASRCRA